MKACARSFISVILVPSGFSNNRASDVLMI